MILFWGSKGYQKVLGHTQTAIECDHCNNVGTWEITEYGRKFTLYWIRSFHMENLTMFLVLFANMGVKFKNLRLINISTIKQDRSQGLSFLNYASM